MIKGKHVICSFTSCWHKMTHHLKKKRKHNLICLLWVCQFAPKCFPTKHLLFLWVHEDQIWRTEIVFSYKLQIFNTTICMKLFSLISGTCWVVKVYKSQRPMCFRTAFSELNKCWGENCVRPHKTKIKLGTKKPSFTIVTFFQLPFNLIKATFLFLFCFLCVCVCNYKVSRLKEICM